MLKLSTKGRYATRIMVYLAIQGGPEPARKRMIAEAEGIPADYVEQILLRLRTAGLVRSHRGAKGGFSLSRDPRNITVAQILEATEGPLALAPCQDEECERVSACVTRGLWQKASDALEDVFGQITVADLAEQTQHLRDSNALTFAI